MIQFSEIQQPVPNLEEITSARTELLNQIESARNVEDVRLAMQQWDQGRRETGTWEALVHLRFCQDTTDEQAKQAQDEMDQMQPKLTELDINIKRALVSHPLRSAVEKETGAQLFALWEAEIPTFDPVIADDMIRESGLKTKYTALMASAKLEFDGDTLNHSTITRYRENADRDLRYAAELVRWQWFDEHAEELDDLFDEMVSLRHGMAQKLDFENYVDLGYQIMSRVDYDQHDVARYRDMVREEVTPLGQQIRDGQATTLGIDKTMFWDESVYLKAGNPLPASDYDTMIGQATEMFNNMGYGLDDFFRVMNKGGFMDLQSRDGKAGGGFCTAFSTVGMPYIYANFKGTRADVQVFTHEMGHAFQCYMSNQQPWFDYLWPTYESCEIHSMSLEMLCYPQMELFFGEGAADFRHIDLASTLTFLPYGVTVDEFQHLVYAKPQASRKERHEMWQQLESTYEPYLDYGDLPHVSSGGRWQEKQHIFCSPFYYIDYTLAQTCALQFWIKAEENREQAMQDYVALCKRGGEAPFQELVSSAKLISPFKEGCLRDVVAHSRQVLGI
ncbi:MAG: M3 family oligoendopeptidase [Pirellulales bacterium]|jgi:M3 family oligoendopeptidase